MGQIVECGGCGFELTRSKTLRADFLALIPDAYYESPDPRNPKRYAKRYYHRSRDDIIICPNCQARLKKDVFDLEISQEPTRPKNARPQ